MLRLAAVLLLASPAVAVERGVPTIPGGAMGTPGVAIPNALPALPNGIPALPVSVLPNAAIPAMIAPNLAPISAEGRALKPEAPTASGQLQAAAPNANQPTQAGGDAQKGALDAQFDGSEAKHKITIEPHDGVGHIHVVADGADSGAVDAAGNPIIIPDRLKPLLPGTGFDRATWNGRVTLHLHSVYSDGIMEPEEVVQLAYDKGVRVLSVTEHDTTASTLRAYRKAKSLGMEYHPGVEMTARGGAHIGAVDVDVTNPALAALLARVRDARLERAKAVVAFLNRNEEIKRRGITITVEEVIAKSKHEDGGTIELPHVARVLVDKGLIQSVDEAFDTYLKGDVTGGAHVTPDPTAKEVIDVIHAAGGKAIINHPYTVDNKNEDSAEKKVREMARLGLDGVEVYRRAPGNDDAQKKKADERAARWLLVADSFDLAVAPGSDFHGDDTHLSRIAVWMPNSLSDQLLKRLAPSHQNAVAVLEKLERASLLPPTPPARAAGLALAALALTKPSSEMFWGTLLLIAALGVYAVVIPFLAKRL